ncbi:MAG: hypothetical protein PHE16_06475 [Aliarcobacter sp.]|nr:hypothetical protein [Aliarcobacter sp.]
MQLESFLKNKSTSNINASQVAFELAISREHSRMFGMPPKAHINHLKLNLA